MKNPLRRAPGAKPSPSQTLKELRVAHGVSQQDLANAMGASQPGVLKAKNANDPQLTTIRRYLEGLGTATGTTASLEVIAVIDGGATRSTHRKEPPT